MLLPLLQNNLLEGGNDVEVGVGTASLSLATHAATISYDINVAANAASLTLATQAASVALDVGVSVGTAGLTLATHAASVSYDVNVAAGTAPLTLTTYSATVDAGGVEVSVGLASLALTTYQALIDATDAVLASAPAGRGRRRRHYVEIDGQNFEVSSYEEAEELLRTALETAKQHADTQAKLIVDRRITVEPGRPAIKLPKIRASKALRPLVAKFRDEIKEIYESAARKAAEALNLRLKEIEEEEEAITMLLLH